MSCTQKQYSNAATRAHSSRDDECDFYFFGHNSIGLVFSCSRCDGSWFDKVIKRCWIATRWLALVRERDSHSSHITASFFFPACFFFRSFSFFIFPLNWEYISRKYVSFDVRQMRHTQQIVARPTIALISHAAEYFRVIIFVSKWKSHLNHFKWAPFREWIDMELRAYTHTHTRAHGNADGITLPMRQRHQRRQHGTSLSRQNILRV